MSARPVADPAPATTVAGAGSRRPGVVVVLVAAVLLTALVQGLVLQSYFVPTAALAPAVQPGDRVLVWKLRPSTDPGDLVVVDTTATASVDRSTPESDGVIGRVLAAVADLLHVDTGRQDHLAVVSSAMADEVTPRCPRARCGPPRRRRRHGPAARVAPRPVRHRDRRDPVTAPEVDPVAEGKDDEGRTEQSALRLFGSAVKEIVVVVGMALALSFVVKTWLLQAFFIPSGSMEDTLLVGDRVVVSKLTPGPIDLQRGDVVVFQDPGGWLDAVPPVERGGVAGALHDGLVFVGLLPAESEDHLIKRVIGLPGDHVVCCDKEHRLTVNDVSIGEEYLKPGDLPSSLNFDVTVPEGHVWVMGDHRSDSEDSRFHGSVRRRQ